MPVDVQVSESLYSKLDSKKLQTAIRKAVKDTTMQLEGECKDYSPVDTGNLKRSHSYDVKEEGTVTRAQVKNSTNYWPYVEYGTSRMPPGGYIQRAVEVVDPADAIQRLFGQYYQPGGK